MIFKKILSYDGHSDLFFGKIVRVAAVFSTILYMVCFFEMYYGRDWMIQEHPASPHELFILYFLEGFGVNFGLYFITTMAAKRHRVLSTFIYIPSVFISPLVNGYVVGLIGFPWGEIVFFAWSLIVYFCFNPWRKTAHV